MPTVQQTPTPAITVTRNFLGQQTAEALVVELIPRPHTGGLMAAGSLRKGGDLWRSDYCLRCVLSPVPGGRRPDGE